MQYRNYAFHIELMPESEDERRLAIALFQYKENARSVMVVAASDSEREAVKQKYQDAVDAQKGKLWPLA